MRPPHLYAQILSATEILHFLSHSALDRHVLMFDSRISTTEGYHLLRHIREPATATRRDRECSSLQCVAAVQSSSSLLYSPPLDRIHNDELGDRKVSLPDIERIIVHGDRMELIEIIWMGRAHSLVRMAEAESMRLTIRHRNEYYNSKSGRAEAEEKDALGGGSVRG